jgi:hypothetical protein
MKRDVLSDDVRVSHFAEKYPQSFRDSAPRANRSAIAEPYNVSNVKVSIGTVSQFRRFSIRQA